jgi:hypothetical protein
VSKAQRKPGQSRSAQSDSRCLTTRNDETICYACLARRNGRPTVERHHVAGRHNLDATVPMPANDHRILSDMQRAWPDRTLRNPDGSLLLRAAAAIRGWLDALTLMIERAIGWIPELLEALDGWLCEHVGRDWWKEFAHWLGSKPEYVGLLAAVRK